ncbi:glycosyltransferase family 2 protein [Roseomonas populi]|uniref:Galactosyltransferase-related protein n=1 Tax=Roseomonas populi TaxID=3121582 RepID=A0ABT1X676_9PROT|nr:galactosyltransferase-related protein [Roseomonas pecuniae]MCR0983229.1 galactosyltransferase-related protein [Roseomonas pecuniae]
MAAPDVSVLTLVKGRDGHLANLLAGLARGTRMPSRCVVVDMGETPALVPPTPFPVLHHRIPSPGLPLARARNAAVALAETPLLAFLDVDCIPAANLVEALAADASAHDALICCEIRYLPPGVTDFSESSLMAAGQRHAERRFPEAGVLPEANTGLFWSLAFAMRRESFLRLGGFDEGFTGYGGEDTDFAFRAREAGLPLLFTASTTAFHQHHMVHEPPLQHFADIVANATRFRARHGFWPMDGWLDAFARMGLIEPPGAGEALHMQRAPTAEEIRAAQRPERAY